MLLRKLNDWLEPTAVEFGRLVRQVTGWVPVQVRRTIRLGLMGLVVRLVDQAFDLGLDDLSGYVEAAGWSVGIAVQELAHRTLSPATPDRERS